MKITNERKGIFLFYSDNMNKKFQWNHFQTSDFNLVNVSIFKSISNQWK